MGIKSSTFYDSGARRRKVLYALSFLVVVGCLGAILWLSGQDSGKSGKTDVPDRATGTGTGSTGAPPPPRPATTGPDSPRPDRPAAPDARPDPSRAPLSEAERLYDVAMNHVRKAMESESGTEEAKTNRRAALNALLAAQKAFESWLDAHPEDERTLDRHVTEIQSQLYWIRKSMTSSEFGSSSPEPASEGPPAPPVPGDSGGIHAPSAPTPASERPPPHPHPTPTFKPEESVARFAAATRRAFYEGRPEDVVAAARELLADPRMQGHTTEIERTLAEAEGMAAFLDSVREGLASRVNQEITLALRKGTVTGILTSASPEIVVRTTGEGKTVPVADLAPGELVARAEASGRLAGAGARLAAGRYLLHRRDADEAAHQLLLARSAGADVSEYEEHLKRALARSEDLRALAAWLDLAPALAEPTPEGADRLREFREDFSGTELFREHRLDLLAAESRGAAKRKFEIEMLWSVPARVTGGGQIHMVYPFDDPAELADFRTQGEFRLEGGDLVTKKGKLWLGRFDIENVDLSFALPGGDPVVVGFWQSGRADRQGVNLSLATAESGLVVTLRHGDRKIEEETIRVPGGAIEVLLQKRGDKYQVRVNRKPVLKGADNTGRSDDNLRYVGLAAAGPVRLSSLELATSLDMDWAKAGGEKFGGYIDDFAYTGPFPIDPKNLKAGLAEQRWPETRPFDPSDPGDGGGNGPAWKFHRGSTGWLDLNRLFKKNDGVAAYAVARIWSPDRRSALLDLVADDRAKAWLNQEVVADDVGQPEPTRVPVRLNAGDNVLMLEVVDERGGFWTRARLLTKGGEPMPDVIPW